MYMYIYIYIVCVHLYLSRSRETLTARPPACTQARLFSALAASSLCGSAPSTLTKRSPPRRRGPRGAGSGR